MSVLFQSCWTLFKDDAKAAPQIVDERERATYWVIMQLSHYENRRHAQCRIR